MQYTKTKVLSIKTSQRNKNMRYLLKIILFLGLLGTAQAQESIIIEGYLTSVVAHPLGYSNREVDLGYLTCTFQTTGGVQTINTFSPTVFNSRRPINHTQIGVVAVEIKSDGEISMRYPSTSFPNGQEINVGENIKYRLVFKQLCFNKLSRVVADVYFYNTIYNPNDCQGFTVKEGSYQGGDSDEGVLPRQDTMLIPNWSFFDKDGKIYALVECERL
jgi:hypothetical protein